MSDGHDLVVEFVGDERALSPGDELTFGRAADLVVDENPYLHRVLGRFSWRDGMWWLANTGSSIALRLSDATSPSFVKVAPGVRVPVTFESSRLAFEAGASNYELRVELLTEFGPADERPDEGAPDAEATTSASDLPLNDEQRLLLVALAAPALRDAGAEPELPTNREVAATLGWTITTFNRKLDGLCRKYSAAGVSGLRGSSDLLARDRRLRLVEHVVTSGVVGPDDRALLDGAG